MAVGQELDRIAKDGEAGEDEVARYEVFLGRLADERNRR